MNKTYTQEEVDTLLSQATKEAVEGERERICKDLIERSEPYDNAKWLNTLTPEQIKYTILHPHSKDEIINKNK